MTPSPHRRVAALAAAGLVLLGGARADAQQIVYDPTATAKIVEQGQTALQQLQAAQRLYDGFNQASGVNGLATSLENPALRAFLPDAGAYARAGSADGFGALGGLGDAAKRIRDAARAFTPPAGDAQGQALAAAGDRAARDAALGQAVAAGGAQRLAGLQQLQGALGGAADVRAVLDLQARLSAEQAMIANDQMRLQGFAMSQAADDRLAVQRQREQAVAAGAARLQAFQAAFQ